MRCTHAPLTLHTVLSVNQLNTWRLNFAGTFLHVIFIEWSCVKEWGYFGGQGKFVLLIPVLMEQTNCFFFYDMIWQVKFPQYFSQLLGQHIFEIWSRSIFGFLPFVDTQGYRTCGRSRDRDGQGKSKTCKRCRWCALLQVRERQTGRASLQDLP